MYDSVNDLFLIVLTVLAKLMTFVNRFFKKDR